MKRVTLSLGIISALILVSGAVLTVKPSWDHPWILVGRIAGLGLTLGLLFLYVFRHSGITAPSGNALGKPRPTPPSEPTKDEILEAYASLIATYDKATLDNFVEMLIDLPNYLVRINEDAEILGESPQLRMTTRQLYRLSARIPTGIASDNAQPAKPNEFENNSMPSHTTPTPTSPEPGLLLVPLIRAEKGTLFDNLEVADARGSSVPTLPNNHVKGLIAYTLDLILRSTPSMVPNLTNEQVNFLESKKDEVLSKLVMIAWAPGPWIKQPTNTQQALDRALNAIGELPVDQKWKDRLGRLCEHFRDNYVIVAEVSRPDGDFLKLAYSHRLPDEGISSKHNRWRARFGMSNHLIDVPHNWYAFQIQAYHFQINAEPGQYVFSHHLERLATRMHVTQDDIESDRFKPYVRLYHNEARSNAHLYIRYQAPKLAAHPTQVDNGEQESGLRESEGYSDRLKSVVRFREIPPGALGGVTVLAWASTVIIYFFALTRLGLDIEATSQSGVRTIVKADMPALLLALPAFSGVLIGAWLDQSRLRRTSVTTYVALACVMAISITSALYFIYDSGRDFPLAFSFTLPGSLAVKTDLVWVCLMVLSSALALFLLKELYSQGRLYFGMVRNRISNSSVGLSQLRKESTS